MGVLRRDSTGCHSLMVALGSQLTQFSASTAVIDGDGAQSYFDLDRAANAVAAALIQAGVTSGSVVATVCPAGRWWLAGSFGVWRAGGVLLPLEASHPPADLRHPITDSAVTHVLCTPATNGLAQELLSLIHISEPTRPY